MTPETISINWGRLIDWLKVLGRIGNISALYNDGVYWFIVISVPLRPSRDEATLLRNPVKLSFRA